MGLWGWCSPLSFQSEGNNGAQTGARRHPLLKPSHHKSPYQLFTNQVIFYYLDHWRASIVYYPWAAFAITITILPSLFHIPSLGPGVFVLIFNKPRSLSCHSFLFIGDNISKVWLLWRAAVALIWGTMQHGPVTWPELIGCEYK